MAKLISQCALSLLLFFVMNILNGCESQVGTQAVKVNENRFAEDISLFSNQLGPVSQICYREQNNTLFVTYADKGTLVTWDLDSGQPLSKLNLGIRSPYGLGFSENCELIIGATEYEYRYNQNFIDEIKVWDTSSGKELYCFSAYCDGSSVYPIETGATINKSGKLFATFNDSLVSVYNTEGINSHLSVRSPDDSFPSIGLVSFFPEQSLLAIAYREGAIALYEVKTNGIQPPIMNASLGKNDPEEVKAVDALAIDKSGMLIGQIRGNNLTIWQRKLLSSERVINYQLSGQTLLQFDNTGKYIIVAGNNKLFIMDIDTHEIIAEYDTLKITSMAISNDNNFIFWGDSLGNIHVMNDKNEGK